MDVEGIAELPGAEANPLTENLLLHALEGALSGNNHRLITAKQQLEEWQLREGYHTLLQVILHDGTPLSLTNLIHSPYVRTDEYPTTFVSKLLYRSRMESTKTGGEALKGMSICLPYFTYLPLEA
jgi:hypothetical protein